MLSNSPQRQAPMRPAGEAKHDQRNGLGQHQGAVTLTKESSEPNRSQALITPDAATAAKQTPAKVE